MIMQHNSMYKEDYKPLFISEMDDDMIKEFIKLAKAQIKANEADSGDDDEDEV